MPTKSATPTTSNQPHSSEAERTIIGALLLDADAIVKVGGRLKAEDFYDPVYGNIYCSIIELWEQGTAVDFVTVSDKLKSYKQLQDIGGSAFLADITREIPTSSHIEHYTGIVLEHSRRRQLATLGKQIEALSREPKVSATELLNQAEQKFLRLSYQATTHKAVTLADMRAERLEHYANLHEAEDPAEYQGICTGYSALDDLISLESGDLIVGAGRPGMGKSALVLNIAQNVAYNQGKIVYFLSLEMSKEQLFDRAFSRIANVESQKLNRGLLSDEEFENLGPSLDALDQGRVYIDDDPDSRLVNIRSKARRQQMEHGLDLLIIDYMQLIQVTDNTVRDSRTREMSYISENIKQLARELHCPVLALSQLSRECERRTDKRPQLSDLRDSGSIEQDADRVLLLYRPGYYFPDSEDPGKTEVIVAKNRQGPTGVVDLHFDLAKSAFHSPKQP